ncbi:unnamed protein product [Meloidogyne enterolobii]|uniref:Uncharacterized protein n=1 Tax=Meloidogyne enterolobii TaxID=390850 RepID=A0ACB1AIW0_MELEN
MVSETTFEQISTSSTFLSSMASLLPLLFISALLFTVSIIGFILHKIMRQVYNKRFEQNMKKHNLLGKNTNVLENTKKYNSLGRNNNVLENTKKHNLLGKNTNVLENTKKYNSLGRNNNVLENTKKHNLFGKNTNVLEKHHLFGRDNVWEKEKQEQMRTQHQEQQQQREQQCSTKYKKSIGSLEEWI